MHCGVSLRIQSECGKIRTRITPNTDTFHAVMVLDFMINYLKQCQEREKRETEKHDFGTTFFVFETFVFQIFETC